MTMALDPDAAHVLQIIRDTGRPPFETLTPAEARAAYAKARIAAAPVPQDIDHTEVFEIEGPHGSIPVRFYRPTQEGSEPLPLLVYCHGGGWLLGDLESHDGVCRHFANGAQCAVLSVDYRLAPEHKFPAAVDDAFAATTWASEHANKLNIDPRRLAIGGDSAGGNLAVAVCLLARDAGTLNIRFQLLLYPALDFSFETPSHHEFAEDHSLTRSTLLWFRDHYFRTPSDEEDMRASPLRTKTMRGLPPACILTAECDPLRDEGEVYATRLAQEANVPVTHWRAAGQIHGFLPMGKLISASAPTLDALALTLKSALS
jgi:acetyl esterase